MNIFKSFFLFLFALQVFFSSLIIDGKPIKLLMKDFSTEEIRGDFSEGFENDIKTDFFQISDHQSFGGIPTYLLENLKLHVFRQAKHPKPGFLDSPYSPPEFS